MDSNESGPDDLLSWDGRKTADFAKVSNDGKWTWDGSEWQPRKKAKKQISTDNQEQDIDVQPQSVPAPKFPKKNEKPVDQTQTTHIGTISPDGRYQWDGGKWVPVELTKLSNDGFWMWDGIDWIPNPSNSAPSEVKQVPMTVSKSSAVSEIYASPNQTPMINQGSGISFVQNFVQRDGKTFYAPLITTGLVFLLMLTPFLIFEHDEFTNSEEKEFCVFIYQSFQSAMNEDEFVESDDLECPMNGYSSSIYSIETISNFEIDEDESSAGDDTDTDSSSSTSDEEERFGIAMLMLFASPFVYMLFALLAVLCIWFKKYPIVVGILQLVYVLSFIIVSSGGLISDGSFELSVHGNFAGIGIYLVGLVSIGYLIPK